MTIRRINYVLSQEKHNKMGGKMLDLANEIDELFEEGRVHRQKIKMKVAKLRSLKKKYPDIMLCSHKVKLEI